jgi:hypothetical protein
VVALAASDGRAAVLLPPASSDADLSTWCAELDVGAIFTIEALQQRVPSTRGIVLLDQAPRTAMVRTPEGREQIVDLGSHVGLTIEGETDLPGREEACLIFPSPPRETLTHRALLAHDPTTEAPGTSAHPSALLLSHLVMPLLAGHTIQTTSSR